MPWSFVVSVATALLPFGQPVSLRSAVASFVEKGRKSKRGVDKACDKAHDKG